MNNLSLSTNQQIFLVTGISLAVGIYLIVKVVQWRRGRKPSSPYEPRMRPKQSSSPRVPAASEPVPPTPGTTAAAPSSSAAPVVREPEPLVTSPSPRTYRMDTYWPVEPKTFVKRNAFEDAGEEYPYADGSDLKFGALTPAMAALVPTSDEGRRTMTKTLRNAGYYEPHAWQNFSAQRYLGIFVPLLVLGTLLLIVPEQLEPVVMVGLIVGPALGWALPALVVRSRARERLREIENAMPDMLDLLNMCVSQGMTVPSALGRVSREIAPVYPALSKELSIVTEQARVGSLSQALVNFSDRVDVPEVHSFASLLTQTERMGTSVSAALTDYSDGMRENMKQRADEKANAATFKLLFPTVTCLMPAVFLFLMGPAIMELNRFFSGGGIQGLNNTQALEAPQPQ